MDNHKLNSIEINFKMSNSEFKYNINLIIICMNIEENVQLVKQDIVV